MNRVLAVSGGIDSVVMLNLFVSGFFDSLPAFTSSLPPSKSLPASVPSLPPSSNRAEPTPSDSPSRLIVAHFDHGIRENSVLDAKFVEALAGKYNLEFRLGHASLGAHTSEATARLERYHFLRQVAAEVGGEIYTAHHLDDLVETVAINFTRGTGWRGLIGLERNGIRRPFLEQTHPWSKKDILRYAGEHRLNFREDQSNNSDHYLRNRIREKLFESQDRIPLNDLSQKIFALHQRQTELSYIIYDIISQIFPSPNAPIDRSIFQNLDDNIALELLRHLLKAREISLTRPQLQDFLEAIRTYSPGKYFNLPGNQLIRINKQNFEL